MEGHTTRYDLGRSVVIVAGLLLFLLAVAGIAAAEPVHPSTVAGAIAAEAGAPGPDLAQVTVRPDAPKRVFEEKEDKPWTLLIGKAMLPATLGLGVFVVIWYVMKVTRTRYRRS